MKKTISKNYVLLMVISVVCLVVLVFASSYAYFQARIINNTKSFKVTAGNAKLTINSNSISGTGIKPILDSSKDTKASIKKFTVKRTNDSNKAVCYNLYLVVDSISANIKNSKYLNYEFSKGSSSSTLGNFSTVTYGSDGKAYILLSSGNKLASSNTAGDSYTLKIWLSYDANNDQNSLLGGNFKAHLYATGNTGTTCPSV